MWKLQEEYNRLRAEHNKRKKEIAETMEYVLSTKHLLEASDDICDVAMSLDLMLGTSVKPPDYLVNSALAIILASAGDLGPARKLSDTVSSKLFNKEVENLQLHLTSAQEENSRLEARMKQAHVQSQATETLQEQVSDLKRRLASTKQRLASCQASETTKDDEISRLDKVVRGKENDIKRQDETIAENTAKLSEAKKDLRQATNALEGAQEEIKLLEETKDALQSEKHEANSKLRKSLM